jgi:hypothetical protein
MSGAACSAGIHQAMERPDILAMAPLALEFLPPTPHHDDHDYLRPGDSGSGPRFPPRWLPARHDRTMAELWKIDESDGKIWGFPGLALAGPKWHCPRRFPGAIAARPCQALP